MSLFFKIIFQICSYFTIGTHLIIAQEELVELRTDSSLEIEFTPSERNETCSECLHLVCVHFFCDVAFSTLLLYKANAGNVYEPHL
jgi:hypothetical protein